MKTIAQCEECGCDFHQRDPGNILCPSLICKSENKKKKVKTYGEIRRIAYANADNANNEVRWKNRFILGLHC